MVILGVDPGFRLTGYGIVKKEGQRAFLLDQGALRLNPQKHLSERVFLFHEFMSEKISAYNVQVICLETPFMGKNAQNFLKLGYLRGILYLLAERHKLTLIELAPTEIKMSLTGFGFASKEQVADVILRLFPGMRMPDKLDVTDAVAIAVCGLWRTHQPARPERARALSRASRRV